MTEVRVERRPTPQGFVTRELARGRSKVHISEVVAQDHKYRLAHLEGPDLGLGLLVTIAYGWLNATGSK